MITSLEFFNESSLAVLAIDFNGVIQWFSEPLIDEIGENVFCIGDNLKNHLNTKELLSLQHMLSGDKSTLSLEVREHGIVFKRLKHVGGDCVVLQQLGGNKDKKFWNRDQLELAVSTSQIGLWEWDIVNNVLSWDKSMYNLYEIDERDFSGAYEAWEKSLHHDDVQMASENVLKAIEGSTDFDTIFRVITPLGKIKHIRASAVIYRDEEGQALEMVGINYDVTAKQNRLNRLKSNQFLLSTLFSKAPVGICIFDINGKYVEINPAFTEITGYTIKELNSIDYWDLTPPEYKAQEDIQSSVLEDTGSYGPYQKEYIHKEQFRVPVLLNGVLIHDETTNEKLIWSVVQDLSMQQNTLDELTRSNEELNEFAYVASHDLREPLRVISSYLKLIQERYANQIDEKGASFIDRTLSASDRMNRLISDLLDYSRVDRKELVQKQVDLNKVLDSVVSDMELVLKESKAELIIKELGYAKGEKSQIYRVFQNVISNSLKYAHPDRVPKITIATRRYKDNVEVIVSDNGIGIEPKHHERVFRLFQRLHTREEYPGTGIGLAVVKKIVERHLGKVWLEQNEQDGISVHFTIAN